jgi:hypothetical protein
MLSGAPASLLCAGRDDGQETSEQTGEQTRRRAGGTARRQEMPGKIGHSDVLIVVDVQNDFCPGGRRW